MTDPGAGDAPRVGPVAKVVAEAELTTTHPDRLRELSQHSSARVRDAVAMNPSADDATVLYLAQDPAATIRLGAALNAHDRPAVEAALAASSDVGVRQVLAHLYAQEPGRQLAQQTQTTLAVDSDPGVRERIAETASYRDLYDRLVADPHWRVRGACVLNPRATEADVETLLTDRDRRVRARAVADARELSPLQVERATHDTSGDVRWSLLFREGIDRRAVAQVLHDDPDQIVRDHARAALRGERLWDPAGERDAIAQRAAAPRLAFDDGPAADTGQP